ncbi:hypothetical protein [uncultured Tateyamaria sp.]|uniref:hypothetical protein n=1 Tax=uncultured Tateyamaria sp. TaxID=455651 RepID=UPI00261CDBAC|nr:hypothetical protein [uncultured Tateyamaria sp.]
MTPFWKRIQAIVTRHELWAWRIARQYPLLAVFIMATLWIWVAPLLPALAAVMAMSFSEHGFLVIIGTTLGLICAALFFATFGIWFFKCYFACVGLMLKGNSRIADARIRILIERLSGLTA